MSRTERWAPPAWAAFAGVNTLLMWVAPGYETIPFHLTWISLALVYGVRPWPLLPTLAVCLAVVVFTGWPLTAHARSEVIPLEETAEIPLMAVLFLVMVWHVRRRMAAVTQARLAVEREREAHAMQERFVLLASHELRTPLTVARGYAELLQQENTDPRMTHDVEVVLDELGKLERIAGRLLTVAWAQQPSRTASGTVDVASLACRVVQRWRPAASGTIRAEVRPVVVQGDAERLETALDCLVENAVVHAGDGARIVVRAYPDGRGAVIEVEDDGPGVAPDRLEAVLDGRVSGAPGLHPGLGFTIVTGVVEAHSGELTFGTGAGGGLRAAVRLPAQPATQRCPVVTDPPPVER